jgi:hypothetical protein
MVNPEEHSSQSMNFTFRGSSLWKVGNWKNLKDSRPFKDTAVIILLGMAVFVLASTFDEVNLAISWIHLHDTRKLDELVTMGAFLVPALIVYGWRRQKELIDQMRQREKIEQERNALKPQLENVRADIRKLRELLPICSFCKRVREDEGYWSQVEEYMEAHFNKLPQHGLCPDCARRTTEGVRNSSHQQH